MSLCVLRSLDGSFDLSLIESLGIKQSREIIFDTCMQVTEVCGVCVCAGIGQSNEPPERWRVLRRDVIRPEQPASSNKWTREEQRERVEWTMEWKWQRSSLLLAQCGTPFRLLNQRWILPAFLFLQTTEQSVFIDDPFEWFLSVPSKTWLFSDLC